MEDWQTLVINIESDGEAIGIDLRLDDDVMIADIRQVIYNALVKKYANKIQEIDYWQ